MKDVEEITIGSIIENNRKLRKRTNVLKGIRKQRRGERDKGMNERIRSMLNFRGFFISDSDSSSLGLIMLKRT